MNSYLLLITIYIRYAFRLFTGNLYGILIFVILLYFSWYKITGTHPFSLLDFVFWISNLNASYKIALLSSSITILGFLIAFQTATANWKRQLQAELRIEAAKELDLIYSRIAELILAIQQYADLNIDTITEINKDPEIEVTFNLNYLSSEFPKFLNNRQELSTLHQTAFQLYGRYSIILFATWNSYTQLQKVNESVAKVAEKMWLLSPFFNLEATDCKMRYLSSVDEKEIKELSRQCEESHVFVSGIVGLIRGQLIKPIAEVNLSTLVTITKNRKMLDEFFKITRKR